MSAVQHIYDWADFLETITFRPFAYGPRSSNAPNGGIGLYRDVWIAAIAWSRTCLRDPFGGNVYYVTKQITFITCKFRNVERNLHCDVVHITTVWVPSITRDCNGFFTIKAYRFVVFSLHCTCQGPVHYCSAKYNFWFILFCLSQEFRLVRRPGHGEVNSTVSGIGLLELPEGSMLQIVIEVPVTGVYEVIIRYEVGSTWQLEPCNWVTVN